MACTWTKIILMVKQTLICGRLGIWRDQRKNPRRAKVVDKDAVRDDWSTLMLLYPNIILKTLLTGSVAIEDQ